MLKNEIATVGITMRAVARIGIRTLIAFDTGSTDGTQDLMRELAQELNLALDLFEGKFVDFATSRNVLMNHANHKSHWLVLLDSGEDFLFNEPALALLANAPANQGGFSLPIILYPSNTVFYSLRLVRNNGLWLYRFPVHEYLDVPDNYHTVNWPKGDGLPLFTITQDRTLTGRSSPARWLRDAVVLRDYLETHPNNSRALFYLANTYGNLGQNEKALYWYLMRYAQLDGWWEERELSCVSIVNCLYALGRWDEWRRWSLYLYYEHSRIEGIMGMARRAMDVDKNPMECLVMADLATKVPAIQRSLWFDPEEYVTYRGNLRSLCERRWRAQREETGMMIPQSNPENVTVST
jgi:glycosyltransferase involved in cell wall biosynthesis